MREGGGSKCLQKQEHLQYIQEKNESKNWNFLLTKNSSFAEKSPFFAFSAKIKAEPKTKNDRNPKVKI